MGHFFDNLTKTGLQDPSGNTTFYNSPVDAMNVANAALSKQPGPAMVNTPPTAVTVTPGQGQLPSGVAGPEPAEVGPPTVTTSGGGPQLVSTPSTNLPTVVKPTFKDATTDHYGNVKPVSPNSGLTKLGSLMQLIAAGVQGGSDAIAGGALDAHNGPDRPSAFGLGWKAAKEMPLMRAAMGRQVQEEEAKIAQTQAQTQAAQSESALHQAQVPYFLQRGKAYNALAQQRGNLSTQQQLDLATQDALDNGRDPNIDPNVLQLRSALKAETDAKAKTPAGGGAGATPHTVQTGKGVYQFNPDTGRYDIFVGPSSHEPRQPTEYEEWRSDPSNKGHNSIQDFWRAKSAANAGGRNDAGLSPNQRAEIEGKYQDDTRKLQQKYVLNKQSGMYEASDGTVLSPDQYEQLQNNIEDARFNRYLAAGETPPDLSKTSGTPNLVPAHGNDQPNPYPRDNGNPYRQPKGKKSLLPLGK